MSSPEPTSAVAAKGSTASTGYEPKTGFGQMVLHRGEREFPWEKVSAQDLNTALPKFGYGVGERRKFHQAFVSFIRGIGAPWIIINEWQETGGAEQLQICEPLPGHTFTPMRNLRARGAAELGGSRTAPSGSPARPQYGTVPGLMEPTLFGRSTGHAGPVFQSQSATGLRVQGFGQNPRSPTAETEGMTRKLSSLRESTAESP